MARKKNKGGRPPKAKKAINPQATFGRWPQADLDLCADAAKSAGLTRPEWARQRLIAAAKRELASRVTRELTAEERQKVEAARSETELAKESIVKEGRKRRPRK